MILIPRLFNILQMAPVKTWTGPYQTENQTEVNKNINHGWVLFRIIRREGSGCIHV